MKAQQKVDIIGPFVGEIRNIIFSMIPKCHKLKKYVIKMHIFLCTNCVSNDSHVSSKFYYMFESQYNYIMV